MKKNNILMLVILFCVSFSDAALADPQRAAVGTLKLMPGRASGLLTGDDEIIFKGNSATVPPIKTIRIFGASDDGASGDIVRMYGFDTSNSQAGTYFIEFQLPAQASSIVSKTVFSMGIEDQTIAYRSHFTEGVSYDGSATFTGDISTTVVTDFDLSSGCTINPPDESLKQKISGTLVKLIDDDGDLIPIKGKFNITLFDIDYNDL